MADTGSPGKKWAACICAQKGVCILTCCWLIVWGGGEGGRERFLCCFSAKFSKQFVFIAMVSDLERNKALSGKKSGPLGAPVPSQGYLMVRGNGH